jgi:membrane protein YdbS with pleckstrin-like domain
MILAAVLAVAGALTSFGKSRRHVFTMLLTLLCLALSISAAFLLYRMGRGISWSAAVTAVIAAAGLVFLLPSLRNS